MFRGRFPGVRTGKPDGESTMTNDTSGRLTEPDKNGSALSTLSSRGSPSGVGRLACIEIRCDGGVNRGGAYGSYVIKRMTPRRYRGAIARATRFRIPETTDCNSAEELALLRGLVRLSEWMDRNSLAASGFCIRIVTDSEVVIRRICCNNSKCSHLLEMFGSIELRWRSTRENLHEFAH